MDRLITTKISFRNFVDVTRIKFTRVIHDSNSCVLFFKRLLSFLSLFFYVVWYSRNSELREKKREFSHDNRP